MRQSLIFLLLIIINLNAFSQYIGIGNTTPATSLDVRGAIRTRPDSVFISQQYQLVNVSNSSFIRLDGTSAGAPQGSGGHTIILTPGKDGQHLRMEAIGSNGNDQFAKLVSGTYLSNGKRILLNQDIDFTFSLQGRYIDLFYSDVTGWTETGRNLYVATDRRQVFTESGIFTVPIGVSNITVALWGAGGHGGGTGSGSGGHGGFVAGTINVAYGEQLTIAVAGPTQSGANGSFSAIRRTNPNYIMLAAAGGNGSSNGGNGGNAGPVGQNGTIGTDATGGAGNGGTVVAAGTGGAAGAGITSSAGGNGGSLTGGNTVNVLEGEGGSGWFGGGGSGTYSDPPALKASGGGGGGSNYVNSATATATHNTHVLNITPPNVLYDAGGIGGAGNAAGTAGKVIITW